MLNFSQKHDFSTKKANFLPEKINCPQNTLTLNYKDQFLTKKLVVQFSFKRTNSKKKRENNQIFNIIFVTTLLNKIFKITYL